jgi:integrase
LGDIARLTWENLDLDRGELRLVSRKTGKRMIIPFAAPLRAHVDILPAGDNSKAPIHPKAFATLGRHGRVADLSNQFVDLLAQAGFRTPPRHAPTGKVPGRMRSSMGLSFHNLRHSTVSLLKEAGEPEAVVMELVGHTSKAMSHHYTHVGKPALTNVHLAAHGRPGRK